MTTPFANALLEELADGCERIYLVEDNGQSMQHNPPPEHGSRSRRILLPFATVDRPLDIDDVMT